MSPNQIVTAMVLSSTPVGEYDKRLVLLSRELGKITVFARGARRPKSQWLLASNPMAFGRFELYVGRNSYSLNGVDIDAYFMELAKDYESLCLASYFLEMASYYALENVGESERLLLLYRSLQVLLRRERSLRLIRMIYEIRTMGINGDYPNVFSCLSCGRKDHLDFFHMGKRGVICRECQPKEGGMPISNSALYAFSYILTSPIKKLFSFALSEAVEEELWGILREYWGRYVDVHFRSEAFLQ